ncbi:MAG: glycoside hydrolase family 31 protein [Firmicutes bacterium]|nr:glycoside hydrolase family 31 protein [Bacillota bacterium]
MRENFEGQAEKVFVCGDVKLRLQAYKDDIIRISCTETEFANEESLIVTANPKNLNIEAHEDGNEAIFKTKLLSVTIDKRNLSLHFKKANGEHLLSTPHSGIVLSQKEIDMPTYQKSSETFGKMEHAKTNKVNGYAYKFRMNLEDKQVVHGLGSGYTGAFDRKNNTQHLFQYNYNSPVPFICLQGYGVLFDTCAYSTFRKEKGAYSFYSEASDMFDAYFIAGDCYDEVISGYRHLTGKAGMLPLWFYGFTQSKERYHTQQELIEVVHEYRKRGIPLDLIVQDWRYWDNGTWSDKSFDKERFPSPKGMCDEVHKNNAKIMISVWPNTKGGESHRQLWEENALLGDGEVYNVFDKKSCNLYWKQVYEGILKHGFDALWCDCSEPYEHGWTERLEKEEAISSALIPFRKYMDNRKINAFSLLHSKNIYEAQKKRCNEKRVVNLTRSGYAGQQRYNGIVWSGDIVGTWNKMREQLIEGLNFCASGLPYWTLDAGGFFVFKGNADFNIECVYNSSDDLGFHELYVRWMQLACFLPMFRSHGTDLGREPWLYGDSGNMFYDALVGAIKLRYRFIPYIYSTAWMVTNKDYTMLRMLAFDFKFDEKVKTIADQFMFGPSIMACPVLEPMYYNEENSEIKGSLKARQVYLPLTAVWYDYYSDKKHEGGQEITVPAPIDKIPIFIKGGGIIVTTDEIQFADESMSKPYTITVYAGADNEFTIYEDSGDGYGYENGEYSEIEIIWDDKNSVLTLADRKGSFDGMMQNREVKIILITGKEGEKRSKTCIYNGKKMKVKLA